MESEKSFAHRQTACFVRASVNPEGHRPMRADEESLFAGERRLLHGKMPSSPFYRARPQRSPGHVSSPDFPQ